MRKIGLEEVAEVHLQPVEIIDAEVVRRLRRFACNALNTLRRFCGRKSPHTSHELPQRSSALRSSFEEWARTQPAAGRATSRAGCRP
jgi:hypothetical protein